MRWLAVLALLALGCGGVESPEPVIEQFSREVVRVRVPYASGGPQGDQASAAAEEVAERYCGGHGRKAAFASFFHEKAGVLGRGAFYFVYRCAE